MEPKDYDDTPRIYPTPVSYDAVWQDSFERLREAMRGMDGCGDECEDYEPSESEEVRDLKSEVKRLGVAVGSRDKSVSRLKEKLARKDAEIAKRDGIIASLTVEVTDLRERVRQEAKSLSGRRLTMMPKDESES